MLVFFGVTQDSGLSDEVHRKCKCCPPADDNGEYSRPNCEQRNYHESRRCQSSDDVRPDTAAVHHPHTERKAALEERAVLAGQNNLEMALHRQQQGIQGLLLITQISAIKHKGDTP